MSDSTDRPKPRDLSKGPRKLDWAEYERLDDRMYGSGRAYKDAHEKAEELRKHAGDSRTGLERAQDKLARLQLASERSDMRHTWGFDPKRVIALENLEFRTNLEGALRRRANQGMDPATERDIRAMLARRKSERSGG